MGDVDDDVVDGSRTLSWEDPTRRGGSAWFEDRSLDARPHAEVLAFLVSPARR